MAMVEDMSVFFNTAEHAVDALWKGTTTVQVILDNQYAEVAGVNGSNPVVLVPTADMPGVARGDSLVVPVGGTSYTIKNPEPDGTGITRLELQKV